MKLSKKLFLRLFAYLFFASIGIVAYFYSYSIYFDTVRPNPDVILTDFDFEKFDISRLFVFEREGKKYLELEGKWAPLFYFPTRPSVYIFDDKGRLIKWHDGVGDSSINKSYGGWWEYRSQKVEISKTDIKSMLVPCVPVQRLTGAPKAEEKTPNPE